MRSAPGTYIWLAALLVTTVVMRQMSPGFEDEFLRRPGLLPPHPEPGPRLESEEPALPRP
ncbi:rhomboid-like protein [Streptomyces sp. NPDC020412]|uniref:rhomboid-like protein n=1 Tax=Streptomyces sp. NPDC020412 TaxID=3365073 RepID=UPI0037BCFD91